MFWMRSLSLCRSRRSRGGSATVEMAICLPVMIVLLLGSIETTDLVFLKSILKSAAYEGARKATAPGQTAAAAQTAATLLLTERGVTSGSVTVSPLVTSSTATGTTVCVTVSAPMGSNSILAPVVLQGITTVSAQVTMVRQ
jgi:Flp pilus assembly protein TadG